MGEAAKGPSQSGQEQKTAWHQLCREGEMVAFFSEAAQSRSEAREHESCSNINKGLTGVVLARTSQGTMDS